MGYNLQGNQILVKIGLEFMELSSKPISSKKLNFLLPAEILTFDRGQDIDS